MDEYDLPVVPRLLENQTVGALEVIGALDRVVETSPGTGIPGLDPEIRNGKFSRGIRGQYTVIPDRCLEMMAILIKPDRIRRDDLLKITRVPIVEGGHDRIHHVCDWTCRGRWRRKNVGPSTAALPTSSRCLGQRNGRHCHHGQEDKNRSLHKLLPFGIRIIKVGEHYNATFRKRSALVMTDTELNVMAALAIIGLRSKPKKG